MNKERLGNFIGAERKALGLTQRALAETLHVTDKAVSKWERGLSYPDVTLLRSICEILEISEHELLTASEDTEGRRAELLARKYLALTRNFRLAQYIFYGLILVICAIVNLSVDRCLSWFFIALTAAGACASLTLLPALVEAGLEGIECYHPSQTPQRQRAGMATQPSPSRFASSSRPKMWVRWLCTPPSDTRPYK